MRPLPTKVTTDQKTTEDHKLFNKIWIHTSRRTIINTEGEEEIGKSQMGTGQWVTNICYSLNLNCCPRDVTRLVLLLVK